MVKQFFLETVELKTAEEAQQLLDRENARKKRFTAALWLSGIASVMIIVGLFGLSTLLALGVILVIPAYILGGFGSALINLLKMIVAGWSCLIYCSPSTFCLLHSWLLWVFSFCFMCLCSSLPSTISSTGRISKPHRAYWKSP